MALDNLYANMTQVVRDASLEELETMLTVLANECERRGEPTAGMMIGEARDLMRAPRL